VAKDCSCVDMGNPTANLVDVGSVYFYRSLAVSATIDTPGLPVLLFARDAHTQHVCECYTICEQSSQSASTPYYKLGSWGYDFFAPYGSVT
jgi:hypothetical protein